MSEPLLEVTNLKTYFHTNEGIVPAVDDITFHIDKAETLGVVGESGCGKSVTALSILQLLKMPPGKIESGEILFNGCSLLEMNESQLRKIRGNDISMIFQEVMTSLNPVIRIGRQITETLTFHQNMSREEAEVKAVELLEIVGFANPKDQMGRYPHELSGGMRQRIMIAIATIRNPKLIIADEPTTALDVTIQAQVLKIMQDMKDMLGTAIMLITHDLGVVAEMADRVIVMYAGKIVEEARVDEIFSTPKHPYTQKLLESIPSIMDAKKRLAVIPGVVPKPTEFPEGCRFHPRCDHAKDICKTKTPAPTKFDDRQVSCWLYSEAEVRS